jgi:hypothetical protein
MNPPDQPYEVPVSRSIRELLLRLHDEAARAGRRAEFLAAVKRISRRLRTDPGSFGEELFDLPALRLTVKVGVVLPVAVEFGVHADRRIVFIRTFRYVEPG